jgi:hypothetical protein
MSDDLRGRLLYAVVLIAIITGAVWLAVWFALSIGQYR